MPAQADEAIDLAELHEAAGILLEILNDARSSSSYAPTSSRKAQQKERMNAIPYKAEKEWPATKLTRALFERFYPVDTQVKMNRKVLTIVGGYDHGNVQVRNTSGTVSTVAISALKPRLDKYALVLDTKDNEKRHAVLKIESTDRGNVKGRWIQFGKTEHNSTIQLPDALFRLIPIDHPSDIDDLQVGRQDLEDGLAFKLHQ